MKTNWTISFMLCLAASAIAQVATPPIAKTKDHRETRHGATVTDPYFWLREKSNPEVSAFLEAENTYTEASTKHLKPFQDQLYKEMLGHMKETDLSVPVRRGAFLYYSRIAAGQQYPVQCRKKGNDGAEEILLDLNEMAKGKKFVSLGNMVVSDDQNLLAFTTDYAGFRQYDLNVKDLRTGETLPDTAARVVSFQWASDNKTIFFTTEDATTKRSDHLWRHTLGEKQPVRIYQELDELYRIQLTKTRDKKFLVLNIGSTDTSEVRLLRADQPLANFSTFSPREKKHKYNVDHRENLFYIRSNKKAINYQILTAPEKDPSPKNWKVFVAHNPDVLSQGIDLYRDFAVAIEKWQGLTRLRVHNFKSGKWESISFPEPVYAAGPGGTVDHDSTTYRYTYQSFVTPPSVFEYDTTTGQSTLLKRQEVPGFDSSQYVAERQWATARDGVKVPLSVIYKKGFERNGKAPLFLYAYGSYGAGMQASFSSARLSLVDRGMVYVLAHIRGGNEMGEKWHEEGMLMKKKNTFTDFIDSAEYLVKEKWAAKDRIVIEGGSAGGLLMGAVVNMRPELFRAVHASVPFVDVMNTMMDASMPLTVGEYLEWGNPNEKAAYDYMKSYSPYDNLEKRAYPAILVTTSFNDSQVMYWEPAKYVARLRMLKTDANQLLLKTKMEPAGHGGASGRYDRLKDTAFEYAWMLSQVGINQ